VPSSLHLLPSFRYVSTLWAIKIALSIFYNNFAKLWCTLMILAQISHHLHIRYSLYNWKQGTTLRFISVQCSVPWNYWDAATHDLDFISPDLWPPNIPEFPTLILWITGYGQYCRSAFIIESLLRMWTRWNCVWLKLSQASIETSLIRRLINGEVVSMHVSTLNTWTLWTHAMTCCFTTVNNLLIVLKFTIAFCFKILYES